MTDVSAQHSAATRSPFELIVPGALPDLPDPAFTEVSGLAGALENGFAQALLAVTLFEHHVTALAKVTSDEHSARWKGRFALEDRLQAEIVAEGFGGNVQLEVERRRFVLAAKDGTLGRDLQEKFYAHMCARDFLFHADQIGKTLSILTTRTDLAHTIKDAESAFFAAFPDVREVGNSVRHQEDRARGLGKKSRKKDKRGQPGKINSKPFTVSGVDASAGNVLLAGGTFIGRRFSATMADGQLGQIEVNMASIGAMRDAIETALGAVPWRMRRPRVMIV